MSLIFMLVAMDRLLEFASLCEALCKPGSEKWSINIVMFAAITTGSFQPQSVCIKYIKGRIAENESNLD